MEPEISAEAVRNQSFGIPPLGKRGYSTDEVDAYLQVIADAIDGRNRLSANDVHNVVFKKPPRGKRGYNEEEVDAFLDAIVDRLSDRERSPDAAGDTSPKASSVFAGAADTATEAEDAASAANAEWYAAKFGRPGVFAATTGTGTGKRETLLQRGGKMMPRAWPGSLTRLARVRAWRGGARGRWLAIVGVITVAVVAGAVMGPESGQDPSSPTVGQDPSSPWVDPMARLTTGACFNLSGADIAVVPCAQPHDDEAYYRVSFPPGPVPDFEDGAMATCDAQLKSYVGTGPRRSDFIDWRVFPDESEWAAGIDYTVCALSRSDGGQMTGSARRAPQTTTEFPHG